MTEKDLDRLERYLEAPERPETTLPLDATQGLLCAVVSAPEPVMPSRWLPAILGDDHQFANDEEARDITALLMELHNDVARQLNEGEGFQFIVYAKEDDDSASIANWCVGYLMGVDLAEPAWEELADPDDLQEMLLPFWMLSGHWKEMLESAGQPPMDPAEEKKAIAAYRESLADEVIANRHYWFEQSIPETVRRETPKVGRNEPCPCGSGKKFKNCCGR